MRYYVRRIDHLTGEKHIVPGLSFPSMNGAKSVAAKMMADEKAKGIQSTFDVVPAILVPNSHGRSMCVRAVRAAKKSLLALGFRDVSINNILIINQ